MALALAFPFAPAGSFWDLGFPETAPGTILHLSDGFVVSDLFLMAES